MDEVAAGALMADGLVWTHVNARVNDNKESVFEPWRSGDGSYTSIEPYDVTARDYGTFVVLTGSSRVDAAYKGTRFLIDCRFTDIWGNIDGNWLMVAATLVSAVATFYFCRLVRDISRNQITTRAEVADIF